MTDPRSGSNSIAVPAATFLRALTALAILLGGPALLPAEADEGERKQCEAEASVCVREMAGHLKKRGWIGIEMGEADGTGRPRITRVVAESPAERAGFRDGDTLIAFNGVEHSEGEELVSAEVKRSLIPGKQITVTVERRGEILDLDVTLSRVPDYLLAQWVGQHMLGYHGEQAEQAEHAEHGEDGEVETAEADTEDSESDSDR